MFQPPFKIFKITDRQAYPDYISFSLHTGKRIICANKVPFAGYKVGDFIGISLDETGNIRFWNDINTISKVVNKSLNFPQKTVYYSKEFRGEWVEE